MSLGAAGALSFFAPRAHAEDKDRDEVASRELDPEDGAVKPDPEDIRTGHFLVRAGGGVWLPSPTFTPGVLGRLSGFDGAGLVRVNVDYALNRYLLIGLEGDYAQLFGPSTACGDCSGDTYALGGRFTFTPTMGSAMKPWGSFGLAYRRANLSLASLDGSSPDLRPGVDAFEFFRLAVGATHYPVSSFGIGGFVGLDVGLRDLSDPTGYAAFAAGLSLVFDPLSIGTSVSPATTPQTAANEGRRRARNPP